MKFKFLSKKEKQDDKSEQKNQVVPDLNLNIMESPKRSKNHVISPRSISSPVLLESNNKNYNSSTSSSSSSSSINSIEKDKKLNTSNKSNKSTTSSTSTTSSSCSTEPRSKSAIDLKTYFQQNPEFYQNIPTSPKYDYSWNDNNNNHNNNENEINKRLFYSMSRDYFPTTTISKSSSSIQLTFEGGNSNSLCGVIVGCLDTYNPKKYPYNRSNSSYQSATNNTTDIQQSV
ncbi:hypothetical protein CYY_004565 [Polysphondylium violaceum]|uniref:Uncharacterized protein n=1 Tax=Polysphondylium violaceum TaxID=133409 RepID=A0A8J4PUF2_9MYCE|nr:hypothetical protein CYY_004565 [Polysphondylium violaceum]